MVGLYEDATVGDGMHDETPVVGGLWVDGRVRLLHG